MNYDSATVAYFLTNLRFTNLLLIAILGVTLISYSIWELCE